MKDTRFIHPAFGGVVLVLGILAEGAMALNEAVQKKRARDKKATREPRPGQALFAGASTPLWNALAAALKSECRKHGDQARLARMVGLPRQRMNNFLHGRGGLPDAERTLVLFNWIAARRKSPGSPPFPGSQPSRGKRNSKTAPAK